MRVPIPYSFGEYGEIPTRKKTLRFCGVSWFKWSTGLEYTYFFKTENKWSEYDFYVSSGNRYSNFIEIDDRFLLEKSFREHGYPFVGSGYLTGVMWIDDTIYADIMITSAYNAHVKVECLGDGQYKRGGRILFPPTPSFETVEKREKFLRKEYKYLAGI